MKIVKFFSLLTLCWQVVAQPTITVTISPLALVVKALTQGVTTPQLLIPTTTSPHFYQLTPSARHHVETTDIIIWISPNLESNLENLFNSLDTPIIKALEAPDLQVLPIRHHCHCCGNTNGVEDPHFWVSIPHVLPVAKYIAEQLCILDPQNASRYQSNLLAFTEDLQKLHQQIKKLLKPVQHIPYLVLHDAYQYYEHTYQLTSKGAISYQPNVPLSLKRIHEVHRVIQQEKVALVFSDPQINQKFVKNLTATTTATLGLQDPLGSDFQAETYQDFILEFSQRFAQQLQRAKQQPKV